MNFKLNSFWFLTTLALLVVIVYMTFKPNPEEDEVSIEDIIDLTNHPGSDSLYSYYAPYIGYVKAIKLKTEGKQKESKTILTTLTKSDNAQIRKIAHYELKQSHPGYEKELEQTAIKNNERNPNNVSNEKPVDNNVNTVNTAMSNNASAPYVSAKVEEPTTAQAPKAVVASKTSLSLTSAKGSRFEYTGDISGDKANGNGVGVYESGSVYKGSWKNNQRNGKGEFRWKDGDRYVGDFSNDYRTGQGTYYWKAGEYYIGGWKQDRRHGLGTLYFANGKVKKKGIWENDKIVKETN